MGESWLNEYGGCVCLEGWDAAGEDDLDFILLNLLRLCASSVLGVNCDILGAMKARGLMAEIVWVTWEGEDVRICA